MTYDPNDSDADGTVEADVDNQTTTTEDAVVGNIQAHHVRGGDGASLGTSLTQSPPVLHAEFEAQNVLTGHDPDPYHRDQFDDGEYRLTVTASGNSDTDLYKTSDFDSFTKVADNIFSSGNDNIRVNDHFVFPDGRFGILTTTNNVNQTDLRIAEDLSNPGPPSAVFPEPDSGAIIGRDGLIHYYAEDVDNSSGDNSSAISHWTAPVDDPTNATQQANAIDVSGLGLITGDPELIRLAGRYYMFLDRKPAGGGSYQIMVAVSNDLYNWQIEIEKLTAVPGGDFAVTQNGGEFFALTEITDQDTDAIGRWRLRPHQSNALWRARSRDIYHQYEGATKDGLQEVASGSGSISLGSGTLTRLQLNTGTTADSHAVVTKYQLAPYFDTKWNNRRVLTADVEPKDTDAGLWLVTGEIGEGTSKTAQHVGMGLTGGDLIATCADGSTRNTATLVSGYSTGLHEWRIEYYPQPHKAEFWQGGKLRGTLTSNLPDQQSATKAGYLWRALVENDTTTDRQMNIYRVRFGQASAHR